jgi:hypothetical protein
MIFGWMSRDFVLKEHDPTRWIVVKPAALQPTREAEEMRDAS